MARERMMIDGGGWTLEPIPTAAVAPIQEVTPDVTPSLSTPLAYSGNMPTKVMEAAESPTLTNVKKATQDSGLVTNWRSGLTAKKGTKLGDLYEKQNQERAARDAAFAAKPTDDPGIGYRWVWQERNQQWARVFFGTPGSPGGAGGGGAGGGNTGLGGGAGGAGGGAGGAGGDAGGIPTPTLARDVFKNTLALFFGQTEMNKPWADELYTTVSKYYKTGISTEESFNLALQDAYQRKAMPEFTTRFKGIFSLQKMRQEGKPVTVPTIAEYFSTQSKMADLLKSTGLGEIATEDFLGDVIGKGVSATEFGNRITAIFDRIDLAPQEMKDTLSRYFPSLDRVQLAKALALGDKGAQQLQKELAGYEVLAAAEEQGLGALGAGAIAGGVTEARAASLAAGGETYQSALGKFRTVAQLREPAAKLAGIYGTGPMTQEDIENIIFKQSAQETAALENLVKAEEAMFSGRAGTIGSRSFASQARGAGTI